MYQWLDGKSEYSQFYPKESNLSISGWIYDKFAFSAKSLVYLPDFTSQYTALIVNLVMSSTNAILKQTYRERTRTA